MISIIIVNYNGKKWLNNCLNSLLSQTYNNFEIICVDNASIDGSVEYLKENFNDNRIKVIENKENSGFAGGNNLGYKYCSGEYILLLNNDTYVDKDFLLNLLKAFDEIPNLGSVQSKLVLMNDKQNLDVCGSFWADLTFLYHYGLGKNKDLEIYNTPFPVFSNKGASMMLKREVIEKVGLFDEDFWCYYEETDLCNRIWVAGYECWYYPYSICYHALGGTSLTFKNSFIQFHNFKNKLLSFLKNFQLITLFKVIPIYLLINILLSFMFLIKGKPGHFLAIYRAIFWNIKNLKSTFRKRKIINLLRKKEGGRNIQTN